LIDRVREKRLSSGRFRLFSQPDVSQNVGRTAHLIPFGIESANEVGAAHKPKNNSLKQEPRLGGE
jgi:hypothetical protein